MRRIGVGIVLVIFASACTPSSMVPPHASGVTVTRARVENLAGRQVRWGGEIAGVTPTERETCFEVIERPLADDGAPLRTEQTEGRFMACTPQLYPRGVYEGQDITVSGTLEQPVTGKLDAFEYRYPRVAVQALHFWPQRRPAVAERYGSRWWQPPDQGSQGYWW